MTIACPWVCREALFESLSTAADASSALGITIVSDPTIAITNAGDTPPSPPGEGADGGEAEELVRDHRMPMSMTIAWPLA